MAADKTLPDLQRLRQALSLETRHAYPNLRGHTSHFADFIAGELGKLLEGLPAKDRGRFTGIRQAFDRYGALSQDQRAEVVEGLSALLPGLYDDTGKPRVAIGREEDWRDRPVQFVKGVGPRTAVILAKVGIQ